MYYEEVFDRGDWWYRTTPRGTWYKFNEGQLKDKIRELQDRLSQSHVTIARLQKEKEEFYDSIAK